MDPIRPGFSSTEQVRDHGPHPSSIRIAAYLFHFHFYESERVDGRASSKSPAIARHGGGVRVLMFRHRSRRLRGHLCHRHGLCAPTSLSDELGIRIDGDTFAAAFIDAWLVAVRNESLTKAVPHSLADLLAQEQNQAATTRGGPRT